MSVFIAENQKNSSSPASVTMMPMDNKKEENHPALLFHSMRSIQNLLGSVVENIQQPVTQTLSIEKQKEYVQQEMSITFINPTDKTVHVRIFQHYWYPRSGDAYSWRPEGSPIAAALNIFEWNLGPGETTTISVPLKAVDSSLSENHHSYLTVQTYVNEGGSYLGYDVNIDFDPFQPNNFAHYEIKMHLEHRSGRYIAGAVAVMNVVKLEVESISLPEEIDPEI
jgi:hypothetical protein